MRELVLTVVNRALVGAEQLPSTDRALLFEGVAAVLSHCKGMKRQAKAALKTAEALREAEHRQLLFSRLFVEEDLKQKS